MRTISLRRFRDSIADQTEPVVVLRLMEGSYQVLGEWHPSDGKTTVKAPQLVPVPEGYTEVIETIARVYDVERPFTPVPKPTRRR